MANENKLTTMGQMRDFAQRQDSRDDAQDALLQQLDEENDGVLKYTAQDLTDSQQEQARTNIGAADAEHTHKSVTNDEIDNILESMTEEEIEMRGVVSYDPQTLTEEQKAQARENIGVDAAIKNLLHAVEDIGRKIIKGEISSIVLLGDSITDGAGGTGYNGSYSGSPSSNTIGYCWANAFKKFAEERYGVTVTNKGMYGTVMVTQKNEALNFVGENDFVIWLTGTNDRNDPDGYQNYMLSYIEAIKEKCAGMLVISNIPSTKADEATHSATMQKMDEIVCAKTAGYVPHFSMYQEFVKYCAIHDIDIADCFADHVHPNDLGYFIMFTVLCQKLGLPLDAHTDYHCNALWWNPYANEEIIGQNTADRDNYAMACEMGVTPVVFMNGYDAGTATTAYSGKHITRVDLLVHTAGTITFGAVPLSDVGKSSPVYSQSKTVQVTQPGMALMEVGIDIGAHETLAVHYTTDTGKLMFNVGDAWEQNDLKTWTAGNFASGTEQCIRFYGTIYGYTSTAENLLLDSTDDYSGSAGEPMVLTSSIVPAALMKDYDSTNKTTAVSGKHITRAVMRVSTVGAITVGTVDLNTVGQTPVYTKSKTINVTETGNNVELLVDMDVGANETLAFQQTTDAGQLTFIMIDGDLSFWLASDFTNGAKGDDFMLYGKLYGY